MASEPPVEPTPAPAEPEPPAPGREGMIGRIKAILLNPKEEFARIAAQPMTTQGIMLGWVAPLAAIGPIAMVISMLSFGYSFLGFHIIPPTNLIVTAAVTQWVATILAVLLLGFAIAALAPNFGGKSDAIAGLKVAAYGSTALYLAGILFLLPALWGLIWLIALYSLYLIFAGLPVVIEVPEEKATGFGVVVLIVACVLSIVAREIAVQLTFAFAPISPLGGVNINL